MPIRTDPRGGLVRSPDPSPAPPDSAIISPRLASTQLWCGRRRCRDDAHSRGKRRETPIDTPARILLIKPSSLGDIIHALPVLAALRRTWPNAHIAWLVGSSFAPLLEGHPLLNEIIPFDRRHYGTMWRNPMAAAAFVRFIRDIRRRRFDLVVDLQGLIRSGLIAYFGGVPRRVGFADAREFGWMFYNERVRCPGGDVHAVERNLHVARHLQLAVDPVEFPLPITPAEREAARRLLREAAGGSIESFTAVIVGARWPSKLWPPRRFAELIDRLHASGAPRCVLLGAPDDRCLADEIKAACVRPPLDLVGRSNLRQLVALLDQAEQVYCLDSGPMHLAAALGKPLVALFGPTNPLRTGPYSPKARVVIHSVPCAPCYRRCCPLGHQACLRELTVDEILAARPPRP
ncbi:MAG: lipopolysaccharide heptosyltransferase II [Planctomycetes bacterium]|nr:lipopolysaccharide heptosyltransferase II [Planctomycetota bacterium]